MKQSKLKWTKIDNHTKVAKWTSKTNADIRTFYLRGYRITAEILDYHPITGKYLTHGEWFVFAEKD